MRMSFLIRRYVRYRRQVLFLATCVVITLGVVAVQNFSVTFHRSRAALSSWRPWKKKESVAPSPANVLGDGFSQADVDYFAKNIEIKYRVVQNVPEVPHVMLRKSESQIIINNRGERIFPNYGWKIFFNQMSRVEPDYFPMHTVADKAEQGIRFYHWNGQLYSFEPLSTFSPIRPGATKVINYYSSCCSLAFTDGFPNWYFVFNELEPRVIESTAGEPERFVLPHNTSKAWKRIHIKDHPNYDQNNPLTPSERYNQDGVKDLGSAPIPVIPTPLYIISYKPEEVINVLQNKWSIVSHPMFQTAITALQGKWKLSIINDIPESQYIHFIQKEVFVKVHNMIIPTSETYELNVDTSAKYIFITASHAAGAFYAVQSLLSLVDANGNIPDIKMTDGPRYRYRGLMIDVARNFHEKKTIMKYINAMAMYKLNKLHLHLTDDEGWRLEIPDLPELTEVGSKRCHDLAEGNCLLPFLGSGPYQSFPGSGYYTVNVYREILMYAAARHIEVIPEFDMPGHGHAAIRSMEIRMAKLSEHNLEEATRYLLSDLKDKSQYSSIQNFLDGAINPCLRSTYRFIEKVMTTVQEIHKDISPLHVFHFGGDEIPQDAWVSSPLCKALKTPGVRENLKQIFAEHVADIAQRHGLEIAAWEDGLMNGTEPMSKKNFPQKNIFVYTWSKLWGFHNAKRAYKLANAGYKVVLTPASSMYFDHPYEPDPAERGLIWATRYLSNKHVFQLTPENIYASRDKDLNGRLIPICKSTAQDSDCPDLLVRENIAGIQGSLFGELTRSEEIIDFMVFPRLIALAERAWHAADWEYMQLGANRTISLQNDWVNFANTLGYKELARLDSMGFKYRISPPGAILKSNTVQASVEFPGLQIQISLDRGNTWTPVTHSGVQMQENDKVLLRTKAALSDRYSKVIHLQHSVLPQN